MTNQIKFKWSLPRTCSHLFLEKKILALLYEKKVYPRICPHLFLEKKILVLLYEKNVY